MAWGVPIQNSNPPAGERKCTSTVDHTGSRGHFILPHPLSPEACAESPETLPVKREVNPNKLSPASLTRSPPDPYLGQSPTLSKKFPPFIHFPETYTHNARPSPSLCSVRRPPPGLCKPPGAESPLEPEARVPGGSCSPSERRRARATAHA